MTRWSDAAVLLGRVLIAALFLGGAVQKGVEPGQVETLLAGRGWPAWLIWPALAFDLGAGGALVLGLAVRPVALALAAYCALTSLFHWIPADPWQISIFVKNWAIAGGCLVLAAHGPGRWAVMPDRPPSPRGDADPPPSPRGDADLPRRPEATPMRPAPGGAGDDHTRKRRPAVSPFTFSTMLSAAMPKWR